ncbi:MAG: hypothetical protein P8N76_09615 [Pirellulaceae bacterium]|nr:hypothetical protein [Pirellulaceae bacterium]
MNENAWGDSADLNRVTYSLSLIYPSFHKRSTFLGGKVIQKRSAAGWIRWGRSCIGLWGPGGEFTDCDGGMGGIGDQGGNSLRLPKFHRCHLSNK